MLKLIVASLVSVAKITDVLYTAARKARSVTQRLRRAAINAHRHTHLAAEDVLHMRYTNYREQKAEYEELAVWANDQSEIALVEFKEQLNRHIAAESEFAAKIEKIGV